MSGVNKRSVEYLTISAKPYVSVCLIHNVSKMLTLGQSRRQHILGLQDLSDTLMRQCKMSMAVAYMLETCP
jgi:hypothetical protein